MIRRELIARIADENPHLTIADAERVVLTIFQRIEEELIAGRRVELRGFGSFSIRYRGARMGRNPRNGEIVPVPAKAAIYFRAGKQLLDRLNAP